MELFKYKVKWLFRLARRCKRKILSLITFVLFVALLSVSFIFPSSAARLATYNSYSDLTYSNTQVQALVGMLTPDSMSKYVVIRTETMTLLFTVSEVKDYTVHDDGSVTMDISSSQVLGYYNTVPSVSWGNRSRYVDLSNYNQGEDDYYRLNISHLYVSNDTSYFYNSTSSLSDIEFTINVFPWLCVFAFLLMFLIILRMR